jgi:hypothetical protein
MGEEGLIRKRMARRELLAGAVLAPTAQAGAQAAGMEADLVIWDSTPAGIIAGIAASRSGLKVVLVTEDKHIGAMQTSGLGNTNAGDRKTVGGLTREFHNRIRKHYVNRYGPNSEQVKVSDDGFFFEPHVAQKVYDDWVREAGIQCLTGDPLEAVEKDGTRLRAIRTADGRTIRGRIFIDASYEGDLLKLAGCSYHLGRESSKQYGEKLAGVRFPPERLGEEDRKLQPFDYRCCLTNVAQNRVPFLRPPGYDPSSYSFHAARMKLQPPTQLRQVLPINWMPNRKTDSRTAQWNGASWDFPEANRERRREIAREHRNYSAGYLWFLLTDPMVPKPIREELSQWGLAKDEFVDNDHWPYHIYVREARRLVGEYVMRESDCTQERFKPDSVGLCSWYLDVHPVEYLPYMGGFVLEGGIGNVRVKPYEIPYRSLLPKRPETENLLVPVALSASHVAFSSIRVEPVWMILGEACGTAAAFSLKEGPSLHTLPVGKLQARLREHGQIIEARAFNDVWTGVR